MERPMTKKTVAVNEEKMQDLIVRVEKCVEKARQRRLARDKKLEALEKAESKVANG